MAVGAGPEAVHTQMTSGSAATIRAVGADVSDAMSRVRDSIELVRYAQDRPEWDSDEGRRSYNMRAWATRASAEVCFNRLNRAGLAIEMAADGYEAMEHDADDVIADFRAAKPLADDALTLFLLMYAATNNLLVVRTTYSERLDAARDFLHTDPFTAEESDWLEHGLVQSMLRDLEHGTMPGPVIPETMATGQDDRGWTPQGLGYDPATGNLLQTGYYTVGEGADTQVFAQLSIIDPDTGAVVNTVALGAVPGDTPPDHAGGVSVHDGTAWVTSSDSPPRLVPYSVADLASASPTSVVTPSGTPVEIRVGATSTVSGDTMYVASHDKSGQGELYTYTWDETSGTWSDERGPFPTPPQVQGISVRGNEIVFSTSRGRDNTSTLQSYNLGDVTGGGALPDPIRTVDLPTMSEGVVMTPDGLLTTYESGSSGYSTPGGADASDMWASTFMTLTPYEELGLAGQVTVVPTTLQAASAWFAEAEAGLDGAETRVARLRLPAAGLGAVPGAAALVVQVDTHLETTATWLGESRVSSGVTADGLIAAANDYEESDARSDGLFGFLQRFVP